MLLIPFLEATEEYRRLKAVRDGERTILSLEKSMVKDISRFFRHQGDVLLKYLPEEFDVARYEIAWDTTQLETHLQFRDLIIKHGRRAAYVGIRTLDRELAVPIQEAERQKADPFRISFDEFDQDAYNQIEQHAGEKITRINETTRKEIRVLITEGFNGELQDDGTTKYKSYSQIAKEIKDRFSDFSAPAPQKHIRNRAELVAVTEIREGYETSKAGVRNKLESRGWEIEKRWSNVGDERVSDGCKANSAAGWIDNKAEFPSGHTQSPRFPGCRCNCQSRVKGRKEQSRLPPDRWIVTRDGDRVTVKRNPKYDTLPPQIIDKNQVFATKDIPPSTRSDLNDTEKATVKSWVDNSDPFNFALRGVYDHPIFNGDRNTIDAALISAGILTEVIEKSELRQAYSVTRGLGKYDVDQVKSALEEKEKLGYSPLISDAGFIAVTFDDKVSLGYSEPDDNEEYYVLKSHLVKGSKALFIGNQNDFTKRIESEILLQKGSSYYIVEEDIVVVTDETGRERLVHYIDVVFIKE